MPFLPTSPHPNALGRPAPLLISLLLISPLLALSPAWGQERGPSSSQPPYATPSADGVRVEAVLTVGDAADNGYRLVGVPDGLGAYDSGRAGCAAGKASGGRPCAGQETFTLLVNHELSGNRGAVRAHGARGAFVSEWVIAKKDLRVLSGRDLVRRPDDARIWNGQGWTPGAAAFSRLCSADLPPRDALFHRASGKGYDGLMLLNGEEDGPEGRALAWIATGPEAGRVYELPHLGRFSRENSLASPYAGEKTVVVGTNDAAPGYLYVYVGEKRKTGNAVERAGLHGGRLFGLKVAGAASEEGAVNGPFSLVPLSALEGGAALKRESAAQAVTAFARPEDGHWVGPGAFYFATTGVSVRWGRNQSARLYRLDFTDPADPTQGGVIRLVKDSAALVGKDGATPPIPAFDNLTCDAAGCIVQEDPGSGAYIAKTWQYEAASGAWRQILEANRQFFQPGAPGFLTQDEEHSGVIEVTEILRRGDGRRYFLATVQAHYPLPGESVEGGQVLLFSLPGR